jgi:hypothetical protein
MRPAGGGLGGRGGGGFGGLAALTIRATTAGGTHQPRRRLRPRERKAIDAARPSSPSRAPEDTRGVGGGAVFGIATRQVPPEPGLCRRARGKESGFWQVMWATVRRNASGGGNSPSWAPPAPVQLHELPSLFHRYSSHRATIAVCGRSAALRPLRACYSFSTDYASRHEQADSMANRPRDKMAHLDRVLGLLS